MADAKVIDFKAAARSKDHFTSDEKFQLSLLLQQGQRKRLFRTADIVNEPSGSYWAVKGAGVDPETPDEITLAILCKQPNPSTGNSRFFLRVQQFDAFSHQDTAATYSSESFGEMLTTLRSEIENAFMPQAARRYGRRATP